MRNEKHILLNGPHLVSPHWGQELTGTFIFWVMGNYFRTVISKHPVEYEAVASEKHTMIWFDCHIPENNEVWKQPLLHYPL